MIARAGAWRISSRGALIIASEGRDHRPGLRQVALGGLRRGLTRPRARARNLAISEAASDMAETTTTASESPCK